MNRKRSTKQEGRKAYWILVVWLVVAAPALAGLEIPGSADLDGPLPIGLSLGAVVDHALWTLFEQGVSFIVLGALALVSLPWALAGMAVLASQAPRLLKIR